MRRKYDIEHPAMRRRRGIVVPLLVVCVQGLWWPVGPWWLGGHPDLRALWLVVPLTVVAAAAAVCRHRMPEAALAAAVAGTVVGALQPVPGDMFGLRPADVIAGPVAVTVTLFALVVHRTARRSVVCATSVPFPFAVLVAAQTMSPRAAAGTAVFVGAACAVVWTCGRLRRRTGARLRAERAYQSQAAVLPVYVALAERSRLATELHDVSAHRLTGIAVAAAAALRLGDPQRRVEAVAHARTAGRQAIDELDELVALETLPRTVTVADIDALVAAHGVDAFTRPREQLSPQLTDLAYRVIRESLTNAARYAAGASTSVGIEMDDDRLTVRIADDGGGVALIGLGSGHGLPGLDTVVRAAGGVLRAGPHGTGWQVCAQLPIPQRDAPTRRGLPRAGEAVRDRALVVLAAGFSLGAVLLPSTGDPDLLTPPLQAAGVCAALVAHALPLAWRRLAPARATAAATAVLVLWVGAAMAGWARLDAAEIFLWFWGAELILVYSLGAYRPDLRTGWWAPSAIAVVGGTALGGGADIHGHRTGAIAVLALFVFVPTAGAWAGGLAAAALRRRRRAAAMRLREREQHRVAGAARSARAELAHRLQRDARLHAAAVVTAADTGRLAEVATAARAALAVLRDLLHHEQEDTPEPPPGLVALQRLAVRRRSALTVNGPSRPLPTAVEVTVYRAVSVVMTDGASVQLRLGDDGVDIVVRRAGTRDPAAIRHLQRIVDEADGTTEASADHGKVRIWLPEPLR